jgi:hypothetical protein
VQPPPVAFTVTPQLPEVVQLAGLGRIEVARVDVSEGPTDASQNQALIYGGDCGVNTGQVYWAGGTLYVAGSHGYYNDAPADQQTPDQYVLSVVVIGPGGVWHSADSGFSAMLRVESTLGSAVSMWRFFGAKPSAEGSGKETATLQWGRRRRCQRPGQPSAAVPRGGAGGTPMRRRGSLRNEDKRVQGEPRRAAV